MIVGVEFFEEETWKAGERVDLLRPERAKAIQVLSVFRDLLEANGVISLKGCSKSEF